LALKKRLTKSLYTERWELLLATLKRLRNERGLTQAQLARRLGRPQSLVAKIEAGERKLDVCQFIDYMETLDADPAAVVRNLSRQK
jgi:transcriptional regulator with XRE-family HTH domain